MLGCVQLGSQWVLSGLSNMNIFQKVDKNNFKKNWGTRCRKNAKECKKQALHGCSVGFSVGSQWVLSGYSVSTQGTHGYSDCAFLSTHGVLRWAPIKATLGEGGASRTKAGAASCGARERFTVIMATTLIQIHIPPLPPLDHCSGHFEQIILFRGVAGPFG